MKKVIIISIISILVLGISFFLFKDRIFEKKEKIIYTDSNKDPNIIVKDDLNVEYGSIKYLSNYINVNNGKLNDLEIVYSDLGDKKVKFSYVNSQTKKKEYRYIILNIVDTTRPIAHVPNYKTIEKNSDESFIDSFLCADNHDKKVERHLEGDYNLGEVGVYHVKYVATDESGNKTEKDITLNVVEKITPNNNSNNSNQINYINYSDIYNDYKNKNTKIGIDISRWQGDVDFKKLKENNVEFIMIRLGGQDGVDGEYYVDSKFTQNINGALENGFDIGIYFYSYAYTNEEAIKQAKYVIKNLKDYKITLPIVFDWECWNKFNNMNVSLYDITKVQDSFLDYVESKGYKGARYGSKNYLSTLWQESNHLTWLAHYTSNTSYEGDYFMWQRSESGKIDGINGAVDIDILYLDKYDL